MVINYFIIISVLRLHVYNIIIMFIAEQGLRVHGVLECVLDVMSVCV